MQDDAAARQLGELTEECYLASLRSWLKTHRGLRSYEDALAQDIVTRNISIEISHRQGSLKVIVTLTAYPAHRSDVSFYRYDRATDGTWKPRNHKR